MHFRSPLCVLGGAVPPDVGVVNQRFHLRNPRTLVVAFAILWGLLSCLEWSDFPDLTRIISNYWFGVFCIVETPSLEIFNFQNSARRKRKGRFPPFGVVLLEFGLGESFLDKFLKFLASMCFLFLRVVQVCIFNESDDCRKSRRKIHICSKLRPKDAQGSISSLQVMREFSLRRARSEPVLGVHVFWTIL